ncbi:hypothetical protein TRFO_04076 [Tritrichomonas foetus]|uniref:Uncharacterized protein n=1 Tax=Tritrichomonas foetus TaxID=1144522 RepID=A0A1J4KMT8_9EUKA|nr:hypothetical protein TRFO_04076 [Tritrichomonas foetus]|eukprot:OHT11116.1 hypothetical protein TRFO_04076 [Tritrichomonas foetus]
MNVKEPNGQRSSPRALRTRYLYGPDSTNIIPEIIDGILHGLSIDKIHPDVYPYLHPEMALRQKKLMAEKNTRGVSTIKQAMNTIEKILQNKNRSHDENLAKLEHEDELREYGNYLAESEEKRKNKAQFTEEELHLGVQLALDEDFDELDPRMLRKLMPELRRLQKESIKNGNYLDAGRYQKAAHKISLLNTQIKYEEMTAEHAEELENRVINMSFDLARLKQKWNKKIELAQEQLDQDIKALIKEQRKKLAEFDEQFNSDVPLTYCKYTTLVADLRRKEEYLVSSKRYDEAHEMRERVEAQMREEEKTFRDKYYADLILKRDDFISKIEKKIRVRQDAANIQIDRLLVEKKREITQAKKALARFELESQQAEALASGTSFGLSASGSPTSSSRRNASVDSASRSARSTYSARSIRSYRAPFPSAEERSTEEIFRQRRAINNIIYTRTLSPRLPSIHRK